MQPLANISEIISDFFAEYENDVVNDEQQISAQEIDENFQLIEDRDDYYSLRYFDRWY